MPVPPAFPQMINSLLYLSRRPTASREITRYQICPKCMLPRRRNMETSRCRAERLPSTPSLAPQAQRFILKALQPGSASNCAQAHTEASPEFWPRFRWLRAHRATEPHPQRLPTTRSPGVTAATTQQHLLPIPPPEPPCSTLTPPPLPPPAPCSARCASLRRFLMSAARL